MLTIDQDNNITALLAGETAAEGTETFDSRHDLEVIAAEWPSSRLVEIYNSIPGFKEVKKFENRQIAINRIWGACLKLAESAAKQETASPATTSANVAPARQESDNTSMKTKKRTAAKPVAKEAAPKAAKKTAAKTETKAPREGTKQQAVIEMLQRKNGASLAEIMDKMGWLSHTTRAFISATLGKKLGLPVESTKQENGERRYRIAA